MKHARIFFGITVFVVCVIGIAWIVGGKALIQAKEAKEQALAEAVHNENIARDAVATAQINGETLKHFSDIDWPKPITLADIKLSKNNTTTANTAYGQAVIAILRKLTISGTLAPELQQSAYAGQEKASLAALKTMKASFVAAKQDIASLTVPPNATTAHVRILNGLTRYSFIITYMAMIDTNPTVALEATQSHTDTFNELVNDLLFMNNYFTANKILLKKNDQIPLYIPKQ